MSKSDSVSDRILWFAATRATGRFTQEDPIGLAGGMNLFGFAGGDPINNGDPFGLCPPANDNFSDCAPGSSGWYANRIATGEGNRALNEIGGTLSACGESWLCQGVLALASLGGSLLEGGVARAAAAAPSSAYDDITAAGARVANRTTNVTRAEFEANLTKSGFQKSVSADGKATLFTKDGTKYSVRGSSQSTGGPTAEYTKAGDRAASLKIRIEP